MRSIRSVKRFGGSINLYEDDALRCAANAMTSFQKLTKIYFFYINFSGLFFMEYWFEGAIIAADFEVDVRAIHIHMLYN